MKTEKQIKEKLDFYLEYLEGNPSNSVAINLKAVVLKWVLSDNDNEE